MKYKITREFTSGIFKGKTHTEITSVKFEVGFVCEKPSVGTSGYIIIAVEEIDNE